MPVPFPEMEAFSFGEASEQTSDLLLAEFIHRAANDFAVASAEVHVASRLQSLAEVRDRLEVTAARFHALASIQRILLPGGSDAIDIGDALCDLCQYQADARFADQGAFVQLRTCEGLVEAKRATAFLMIVSELLTNAARHAFDGPGGLVEIEVTRLDDSIRCRISDNGTGIAVKDRKSGNGTAIVSELARRADITITDLACATGTRCELKVPCVRATTATPPPGV